jgi:hypothetical protein
MPTLSKRGFFACPQTSGYPEAWPEGAVHRNRDCRNDGFPALDCGSQREHNQNRHTHQL